MLIPFSNGCLNKSFSSAPSGICASSSLLNGPFHGESREIPQLLPPSLPRWSHFLSLLGQLKINLSGIKNSNRICNSLFLWLLSSVFLGCWSSSLLFSGAECLLNHQEPLPTLIHLTLMKIMAKNLRLLFIWKMNLKKWRRIIPLLKEVMMKNTISAR